MVQRLVCLCGLLGLDVVGAEVCKGIARLAGNESLNNEYNKGAGWYGKGETSKGQFVASPFADARSDYEKRGGACIPNYKNVECHQSKGKANCNEAQTCTQLLEIKSKLLAGGYNCFGRHERTYWHQYYGETACKEAANCASASAPAGAGQPTGPFATPSRYLSPWGWRGSNVAAASFKALGLADKVGSFASSPFPRCKDGLQHFVPEGASGLDADMGEKLMYTGSIRENLQRKGFCQNATSTADLNKEASYMYIFDELRKLAGTPPAPGKNNMYMTHGFNMKGAFGEQVDEGYWMCLRPNAEQYPKVQDSHLVEFQVCDEGPQPSVDFSGVKQFETDFLLSSESFYLMESCSSMEQATGGVFSWDSAEPKLELTQAEVGSAAAFAKLLEIQSQALDFVPNDPAAVDREVFHLGLFVHNNAGYRYPDTVHVPLRRILEDTISGGGSQASRFAIVLAILEAGDGVDYNCSERTTGPTFEQIATCYAEQHNTGGDWYWGGEAKAHINVDTDFSTTSVYGELTWQGHKHWFPIEHVSGVIEAGACLVHHGSVSLAGLLTSMGCEAKIESKCSPEESQDTDAGVGAVPTCLAMVLVVLSMAALSL